MSCVRIPEQILVIKSPLKFAFFNHLVEQFLLYKCESYTNYVFIVSCVKVAVAPRVSHKIFKMTMPSATGDK